MGSAMGRYAGDDPCTSGLQASLDAVNIVHRSWPPRNGRLKDFRRLRKTLKPLLRTGEVILFGEAQVEIKKWKYSEIKGQP